MNKKEVLEIRRLFTKENSRITRICGCYITSDKEKRSELKEAFASLPEEELYKYLEIFRKVLSGSIGKNLIPMEFPLEAELEGDGHRLLMALKETELRDDGLLETFYDVINQNYVHPENYLILLIHGAYDIPKKGTDEIEMEDASDYVYNFVLCALCPVDLAKPALCYNDSTNHIESRIRDWIVGAPELGFLFPAFTDRNTDIHSLMYYAKNAEELHPEISEDILGCHLPITAGEQKSSFQEIISNTLGEEADLETIKTFHSTMQEWVEERKENPDPVAFDKEDMKRMLSKSGVDEEKIDRFEASYDRLLGEKTELPAANIVNSRKFEVKTPDISIQVSPDRTDLIETRVIDGTPCLVIAISDDVEVNGVPIRKWE